MQQTGSVHGPVWIRLASPPKVRRQRRVQHLQAFQDGRDFLLVPGPNASRPELEPALGELRLEANRFPVRGDRPIEPLGVSVGLAKVKERDKRRSADDARALEGADGLSGLACLALRLPEQVPGSYVLRITLDDRNEQGDRLRMVP